MTRAYKKRRKGQSDHNEKKMTEKKGRYSYVPEEIQRQIMLRLPVKSILRFRSLNKRSHGLISTQQFISDHLITFRHENERQFLVFSSAYCNADQVVKYVDGSVRPVYVQDLAPPPIGKIYRDSFRVVGYCDGVVCMIDRWFDIWLWNPSIRKMTPVVSGLLPRGLEFGDIGGNTFGFGSVDGEHKLIVLSMVGSSLFAYIFSMKTRNWATTVQQHQRCTVNRGRSAFVNGACHWLARDGRGIPFVLSFNLKEHTFGKIDLPNYMGTAISLTVYVGCLSFINYVGQSIRSPVWVMTKYGVVESWIRIMENKCLTNLQDIVGIIGGVAFGLQNGWFDSSKTRLVCYKPTRQRAEWLKVDVKNLTHLHAYQESLVLLNQEG